MIHAFGGTLPNNGTDGALPQSGVIVAADGSLYGVTQAGGSYTALFGGLGTIYRLAYGSSGGWQEQQLYNFTQNGDGALPMSRPAFDPQGNLWGTSGAGFSQPYQPFDGTIWKL
ncbi:MAG: hypothetical protein JOZ27_09180 [Caulobacteraceae bacterium]|nr:hypothetical protein [Caulobacteraceae bacterium]